MHSRELGLVLAQQLGNVEDLHYGLWDPDLELKFGNLGVAQQRYSDMLLAELPAPAGQVRVLDVGCGTGHLISQMLRRGYFADGVIPARDLGALVRKRIGECQGYQPVIHECKFEDFPVGDARGKYDVVLFSESFQYIKPADSLPLVQQLLKDEDITTRVSPNLQLLNEWLMNRARPAGLTIHRYFSANHPWSTRFAMWLFRKRLRKLQYKYFSGHRSRETFERYKTYHLLVYRLPA